MLRGGGYSRSTVFALKLLGGVGKSRAGHSVNDQRGGGVSDGLRQAVAVIIILGKARPGHKPSHRRLRK